jgi:RIO kinase 1
MTDKKAKKHRSRNKPKTDGMEDFDNSLNHPSPEIDKLDKENDRLSEIDSKRFREKKKHKRDDSRTTEGVLDLSTSKEIYKLQKNYLKGLGGIISTGKESNIYYTKSRNLKLTHNIDELAVKVYRTRTLDFKKIKKYIEGDIRFSKISNKSHQIIQTWALKEYKNLSRCFEMGMPVPEPIIVRRNVLVMEFIGNKGVAAPQLRHFTYFEDKEYVINLYTQSIQMLDDLWNKVKLVHGDLSAYNMLVNDDKLIIIDLGQGVLKDHHLAEGFLWRDIQNVLYYFNTFNIGEEPEKIYQKITGKVPVPEFLKI